jgi:glycosyltransferase involved in cell wall biosynthesis
MVPTQGVVQMLQSRGFKNLKPWTHGVDLSLFSYQPLPLDLPEMQQRPRPWALYVGRVSYEKNIDAFLDMPWKGTRIVCGEGPLADQLKARYPGVVWMGVLPRPQLAQVYAAADVFVFPSRNETFGLVMLEAMACGTPVAAYPVDGPLQVMGADQGQASGGVLGDDLAEATLQALKLQRQEARLRSEVFGWPHAVALFRSYLTSIKVEGKP